MVNNDIIIVAFVFGQYVRGRYTSVGRYYTIIDFDFCCYQDLSTKKNSIIEYYLLKFDKSDSNKYQSL